MLAAAPCICAYVGVVHQRAGSLTVSRCAHGRGELRGRAPLRRVRAVQGEESWYYVDINAQTSTGDTGVPERALRLAPYEGGAQGGWRGNMVVQHAPDLAACAPV